MSIRYRKPEETTLKISRGDWLLVKNHLTAGEQRRRLSAMIDPDRSRVDPVNVGMSTVVAYLLDWSIDGIDGKRIDISDKTDAEKIAILDDLPVDDFTEIRKAVDEHEAAMEALREQEKKAHSTESTLLPTSPSVATSQDGPSNMSMDSELMSAR